MSRLKKTIRLGGGVDGTSPTSAMPPGRLRIGINVEAKPGGGYRRVLGYSLPEALEVPGEGRIRGVWYYNGVLYAFRNAVGNATCVMWGSTGAGWVSKKTGLSPDGSYSFVNYAFSGTQKMYGASGVHKAFEWDGTTWTDLTTGYPTDEPDHIAAHKKHLFVSFGNSVQNSAIGDPTNWTPLSGASEILLDEDCTGFSTMPNGSLGIYTRSGITLIAGSSTADWVANNLVEYSNNAGALPNTIQSMGASQRFVDSRGVTDFSASDTSSDFYDAIISHDMDKVLEGRWTTATCATVVRAKNQYRVFFSDGSGLIFVFNNQSVMITRTQFPVIPRHVVNTEDASGNELIYFGADNGFVYQLEDGRSFAGEAINAYGEVAYTDMGMRSQVKRWHKMWVDVGQNGNSNLMVMARYNVDNGGLSTGPEESPDFESGGSKLNQAILGQALLGGAPIDNGFINLEGISEWVAFRFYSSTTNDLPWEIDGYTAEYSPGRGRR